MKLDFGRWIIFLWGHIPMFKKVLNCNDLWKGEKKAVYVDGVAVLMIHTDQGIQAFNNYCPHAGALLSDGFFNNNVITCSRHGWQFEACTGHGINPINTQLRQYPVQIDDAEDIWIDIEIEKCAQ